MTQVIEECIDRLPSPEVAIPQPFRSLINLTVDFGQRCYRHCRALYLTTDSEYRMSVGDEGAK